MIGNFDDILTLVEESYATDEYGDQVITESLRTVFCKVQSIGQSEFYQAAEAGLKPEIKFILADYLDYQDEKAVEWSGKRYTVLRTYRAGLRLEITAYRQVNRS